MHKAELERIIAEYMVFNDEILQGLTGGVAKFLPGLDISIDGNGENKN